ncbi:unnamed protein product, partial [Closterium sp. NIES-65]
MRQDASQHTAPFRHLLPPIFPLSPFPSPPSLSPPFAFLPRQPLRFSALPCRVQTARGTTRHSAQPRDITRNHKVRRQYSLQLNENEMVQKELELLEEDAKVFKLIGPVLVPQDLAEARANVGKRLEYISSEVKRLEGALKQLEQKQASKQQD